MGRFHRAQNPFVPSRLLAAILTLGLAGPARAQSGEDASITTQWTICTPFVDLGPWHFKPEWNLYYQTMLVQVTGCGGANILMHEGYVATGDHGSTVLQEGRWPGWGDHACINKNECKVQGSHDQLLTSVEFSRLTLACVTGYFFITRAGITNEGSVTDCNPWPAFDNG